MAMSVPELHKKAARTRLRCAVLTVSTSKHERKVRGEPVDDASGSVARRLLEESGHEVVFYDVIPDDLAKIQESVKTLLQASDVDFIVTTGGTGLTKRDVTVEAISPLLEKVLPGFGELFRLKSYERVGTAAILSRAVAGVAAGKVIFCLPGSPDAVRLALSEIIIPEVP
ncbi:MAG: MogA/MoaB family molybdenum cofactor biosynthesis protein, partial [Candidatus Alkanophagales archaeon]